MALRFGIIGTGIMGKAGGKILQLVDDLDVVALADISEKSLAAAAEELGVKTAYSSYEEMAESEKRRAQKTFYYREVADPVF